MPFDDIRVEYPLTNPAHNALAFQTKSLTEDGAQDFRVTADGRLERQVFHYEPGDPRDPWFVRRRVPDGWRPVPLTGRVRVYSYADEKRRKGWVEYELLFENGHLVRVQLVKEVPPDEDAYSTPDPKAGSGRRAIRPRRKALQIKPYLRRVERVIPDLADADLVRRLPAVGEVTRAVALLAELAVQSLAVPGPGQIAVADALGSLGSVAVPALRKLRSESSDPEVRVLAAAVLTRIGADDGIPALVHAVREGDVLPGPAAIWLAESGAPEAGEVIEARLAAAPLDDEDLLGWLITALRTLRRPLPEALRARLESAEAPPTVRALLAEDPG